jgi:hypothetical protein
LEVVMSRRVIIPKRITGYKLPDSEEDLDTLANRILTYAAPHIEGVSVPSTGSGTGGALAVGVVRQAVGELVEPSTGSGTGGGSVAEPVEVVERWTDISASSWTAFKAAYATWTSARAACKGPHPPRDTEVKNRAVVALRFTLSGLLERGLFLKPRTAKDTAAMGFNLIDATNTVAGALNDRVVIESVTNDPIIGNHSHIIRYHTKSDSHYLRLPYYQAVFQVYLQGAGDPPPVLNGNRGWSKDYLSENNRFELRHKSGDVGKIAHYRARWETEGGAKGPWSIIASAKVR